MFFDNRAAYGEPYPHAVFMPHVELKKLRADLRKWAGDWSMHSAWALDEQDLSAYLMVAFARPADKYRFEAEVAQALVTG